MTIHERYQALVESQTGMSFAELRKASPRSLWQRFHGNAPVKVESFFPITDGGGSVIHSVWTPEEVNQATDQAIAALGA
jgi:hypothetical protein